MCSVRGTRFLQLVPVTVEQNRHKPQSEILLCMSLIEKAGRLTSVAVAVSRPDHPVLGH